MTRGKSVRVQASQARAKLQTMREERDDEPDEESEFDVEKEKANETVSDNDDASVIKRKKSMEENAHAPASLASGSREEEGQKGRGKAAPASQTKRNQKNLRADHTTPSEQEVKELFAILAGNSRGSSAAFGRDKVEDMIVKLGLNIEEGVLDCMMEYAGELASNTSGSGGDGKTPSTSKNQGVRVSFDIFRSIVDKIYTSA